MGTRRFVWLQQKYTISTPLYPRTQKRVEKFSQPIDFSVPPTGFEPVTLGLEVSGHPTLANSEQHLTIGIIRHFLVQIYCQILAIVVENWKRVEK
jgi:hypothetical protein